MADTEQSEVIDFVDSSVGDTGEDNISSIQPITDGEGATQTTFRRPSENLRHRTEIVRQKLRDLQYFRSFNNWTIEPATGHELSWGGTVAEGGDGQITQVGDLTIRPYLTPASSTKGTLKIGTSGTNAVDYNIQSDAYASEGVDQIFVEHRDAGTGESLSVEISDGPLKRIVVFFDPDNTSHDSQAVVSEVNTAITGDSFLNGKIEASDDGVNGETVAEQEETRVEGTADQEAHVIASGTLDSFTSSNPLSEGDTLAIWYRYLVEPDSGFADDPKGGVAGGRWESNPDRGTASIPEGSLFITSDEPEKIPGAIPICKVVNNILRFIDGTSLFQGAAPTTIGQSTVSTTDFSGEPTNTSNGGIPTDELEDTDTADNVFVEVDKRLGHLRAYTYVVTDGSTTTGGDFDGSSALQDAISAISSDGGTLFVRAGTYELGASLDIPNKIRLVGEDINTTVLRLSSGPGTISFGEDSSAFNLRIDSASGDHTITTTGNRVYLDKIIISDVTEVVLSDKNCVLSNSRLFNVGVTDITVEGSNGRVENIFSTAGVITASGRQCYIDDVITNKLVISMSNPEYTASINNARIFNNSSDDILADVGRGMANFTNCTFSHTHGAATSDVVRIDHADAHVTFENCRFVGDTSGNFFDIEETSKAGVVFNNCYAELVCPTGIKTGDNTVMTWNDSYITDNQDTDVLLVDGTGGDQDTKKCAFKGCEFQLSRTTNGRSVDTTHYSFNNCLLTCSTDSGTFSGDESGRTEPFIFIDSGDVADLNLDLSDQEIEIDSGTSNPVFSASTGLILRMEDSTSRRMNVFNINKHMNFDGNADDISALLSFDSSQVHDLKFSFTGTASAGGGDSHFDAVYAVNESHLSNVELIESEVEQGIKGINYTVVSSTIDCITPVYLKNGSNVIDSNIISRGGSISIDIHDVEDIAFFIKNNFFEFKNLVDDQTLFNVDVQGIHDESPVFITGNYILVNPATEVDKGEVFGANTGQVSTLFVINFNYVRATNVTTTTTEVFFGLDDPGNRYTIIGNQFEASPGDYTNTRLTGTDGHHIIDNNSFR